MVKPKAIIRKTVSKSTKLTAYIKVDQRWNKIWINQYNKSIHDQAFAQPYGPKLIAKRGKILAHHFAYKNKNDSTDNYDAWYAAKKIENGKGQWHSDWQSLSNPNNVEVIKIKDNVKHIADMISNDNKVIEFQHSPLSKSEIDAREQFYDQMLWVMDATKNFNFRIGAGKMWNKNYNFYAVKFEACDWWGFTTKLLYLDIGIGIVKPIFMSNRFLIGIFVQYKYFINKYIDTSNNDLSNSSTHKYFNMDTYNLLLDEHNLKIDDDKLSIYGNNYHRRAMLKEQEFKYNGNEKCWSIKVRSCPPCYVRPDPLNL